MSIVRVGMAEDSKFSAGYDAIFKKGKKAEPAAKKPAAKPAKSAAKTTAKKPAAAKKKPAAKKK